MSATGRRRRATGTPPARLPDVVWDGAARYEVVRAWPRGREHALLELTDPDGVRVAGQWFADEARLAEVAAGAPAPARVTGAVLLQPDGADARLPRLPGALAEPGARLVAHRPGRRAVVHVPDEAGGHYVKVVRPKAGAALAERGQLVHELLGAQITVPRLREDSEAERGLLRWTTVPGTTLHDRGQSPWPLDEAERAWHTAGTALSLLHNHNRPYGRKWSSPEGSPQPFSPIWTVGDELGAVADWVDAAVHHQLLDPVLVAEAGDRVAAGLEEPVAQPVLGLLHRDLHDKQLLLDDTGAIGMIDVDTLTVGERALDIANALVHLELRQAQGLLTPEVAAAATSGFRRGVSTAAALTAAEDEAMWSRVAAYADATRLRLAGVYAFRPRWRPVAQELLASLTTTPPGLAARPPVAAPRPSPQRPWPVRSAPSPASP